MGSFLPSIQRAVIVQEDKTVAVETVLLDKPGPGEVLVKNAAIGQNPGDWKAIDFGMLYAGNGLGYDFAGHIAALGEVVTSWKVRDRVGRGHRPALESRQISEEFVLCMIARESPLVRIPDNITEEEVVTIPLAASTALHGLNLISDIPKRAPLAGGRRSSGVAPFAIQLARIYKVITTASPKNHALVKSLGAAVAIDCHASDVVEQTIAASGRGGVDYVFDAVSEGSSYELGLKTLRKDGPRKLALVSPLDVSNLDQSVDYYFAAPIAFLDLDPDFGGLSLSRNKAEYKLGLDFFENAPGWLQEGRLEPNPVTVSGTKLVYRVAETPA
ncbi:GroES-like protein [Dentipellis sp. KUC8613]|nr:GroES-like protein [Dentipellis sp. KUC8613]